MRFALLALAAGHICVLSPQQRGPVDVSIPGSPPCYRRTSYCGGVKPAAPLTTYAAGGPATILLQQNLNHWNHSNPGFIDVALSYSTDPKDSDWIHLARQEDYPAFEMATQTNFSLPVTMPAKPCEHCILRVRYVSYNNLEIDPATNTDAIFYNCADITLIGSGAVELEPEVVAPVAPVRAARLSTAYECAAPATFTVNCSESTPLGVVQHTIWWDAAAKRTRIDRKGAVWTQNGNDHLSLINDYAKPREFVNWVSRDHCEVYGNDLPYAWTFGASSGMTYEGRGSNSLDSWSRPGGYSWVSRKVDGGLCVPVAWNRGVGYAATCGQVSLDPIAAKVFVPDASCTKSPIFGGCHQEKTAREWDEVTVLIP